MSVADRYSALRANPATSNAGYGWSQDEIRKLEGELKDGTTLSDIAVSHKRTVGGVAIQCRKLAMKAVSTKRLTLENASRYYQTPAEKIQEGLEKRTTIQRNDSRTTTENSMVGDALVARLILRIEKFETMMNERFEALEKLVEELQETVADLETNQE